MGQIQAARDPRRLLVVAEARRRSSSSSAASPAWPNGGWPDVVAEPDRLGEVLVQPQRPRDDPRDAGRLERVRHPRAVVVAGGVDEDLRLALQAAERLRVQDAVAVALERRAHAALVLGALPPARLVERTASGESACAPTRASARRKHRQFSRPVRAFPLSTVSAAGDDATFSE